MPVSTGRGAGTDTAGYIIARSQSYITWIPVNGASYSTGDTLTDATVVYNGTESSFNDTDVSDGHEYHYKIFAYNSDFLYSYSISVQLLFEGESDLLFDRFPWVDNYIIYYGALDSQAISTLKEYDMAIIHPTNNHITRDQVRQVQRGKKSSDPSDDVLVIAYVAVGEDLRTTKFYPKGKTEEYPEGVTEPDYDAMLADERFTRNIIGPRVDPRGPKPNGAALEYNYSIGSASPGGSGFASYYLDDNDVVNGVNGGLGDGKPDFNESWRGAFVNAGDPLWFQEVDQMRYASDGVFGLQELLTTTVGEGLGVDGIFMDAMDTFAPNSWTSSVDEVQCEFEWTAPGFADFIRRLKEKYPDKIVVQNRAVYLFRSGFVQQYLNYTSRPYIDFLMFESFRLNSSDDEDYSPSYYPENRYDYAPPYWRKLAGMTDFRFSLLGML